jgi:hypothetical protein
VPRPSVAGWFDSTIQIWRPSVTRDELGAETRTYARLGTPVGASINRSRTPSAPAAAGLTPTGQLRWYGLPTLDIVARDVCEVLTGPDAGRTWEVNEMPVRPRGHHTQVDCIEWHGVLEEAS